MTGSRVSTRTLLAVLVALIAGLVLRSWLQVELLQDGWNRRFAADLSYLVVPPVLLLLLSPLWRSQKSFLASQFQLRALTWALLMRAVAIGFLLRLFSWGYLIASVALGWQQDSNPQAIVGPEFSFQCAAPLQVLLGFVVMALIVPTVEEIIHRGGVISNLRNRGPFVAIVISAVLFTLLHPASAWLFAFLAGLAFGYQYWHSNLLWPSLFSHVTINGLIQIDWYCFSGKWNPLQENLPLFVPSLLGILLMAIGSAGTIILLAGYSRGTT